MCVCVWGGLSKGIGGFRVPQRERFCKGDNGLKVFYYRGYRERSLTRNIRCSLQGYKVEHESEGVDVRI